LFTTVITLLFSSTIAIYTTICFVYFKTHIYYYFAFFLADIF